MALVQERDRGALAVLFERYHRMVRGIAARILGNFAEAEDVTQSVFLELLCSAARFDPSRGKLRTWLVQYAYHRSFNRKRYLCIRSRTAEIDLPETAAPAQDYRGLNQHEARQFLSKGLLTLSPVQRTILEQAFFEGRTLREIASRNGISYGNARHYFYRGLEKLRLFMRDRTRSGERG